MKLRLCLLVFNVLCVGGDLFATEKREMVDSINPMIGAITLGGYGGHGLG